MLKNYIIQELVSPEIYQARGERAWELIDTRAAETLQALRDRFGICMVNNWHAPYNGAFKSSGLRNWDDPVGAKYSQHKYGRGFDCKFRHASPQEVYAEILRDPSKFPHLTTLEDVQFTPTWLHFDTRYHSRIGIWVVKP